MTFFWRATQFASALFLVAVGIWEMYDNWQLHPWYFISLLGLYSLLAMQTDRWHRETLKLQAETSALWEGTAEKLFKQVIELTDSLYDVRVENDKLKRKQKEWN